MDRRLAVAGMMALPMCRRDIGDYLGLTLRRFHARSRSSMMRAFLDFPAPARSCCAIASDYATWTFEKHQSLSQTGGMRQEAA
jgi:hypothetical protein